MIENPQGSDRAGEPTPVDPSRGGPGDPPEPVVQAAAWCVHFYTAIGLICAAWIAVLVVRGGAEAFRWSFLLMVAACLVDATDGRSPAGSASSRSCPSSTAGSSTTWSTSSPTPASPCSWSGGPASTPSGSEAWLLLPLMASAYGFCQVEAKTDDGYFLGFPSLWNVVALYLYILQLPPWVNFSVVTLLAVMTFVPTRYLYMSLPGRLNRISNFIGTPWIILLVVILWRLPSDAPLAPGEPTWWLGVASLYFPAFYMIASWVISFRLRHVPVAA